MSLIYLAVKTPGTAPRTRWRPCVCVCVFACVCCYLRRFSVMPLGSAHCCLFLSFKCAAVWALRPAHFLLLDTFFFFWFAAAPLLVARRAPVRRGTEEQKQGNDSPPFVPVSKFVCARQGRKQLARKGDRKKKSDFLKVGVWKWRRFEFFFSEISINPEDSNRISWVHFLQRR